MSLAYGCKQDTMSQHDYFRKGLYDFVSQKKFFIWMNFGTICFATCYNKCL
jgi:hypothetical protein